MSEDLIEEVMGFLQAELGSTCWKEASGGSDYSEHKEKLRKCLKQLEVVLEDIRYPDEDFND